MGSPLCSPLGSRGSPTTTPPQGSQLEGQHQLQTWVLLWGCLHPERQCCGIAWSQTAAQEKPGTQEMNLDMKMWWVGFPELASPSPCSANPQREEVVVDMPLQGGRECGLQGTSANVCILPGDVFGAAASSGPRSRQSSWGSSLLARAQNWWASSLLIQVTLSCLGRREAMAALQRGLYTQLHLFSGAVPLCTGAKGFVLRFSRAGAPQGLSSPKRRGWDFPGWQEHAQGRVIPAPMCT